MDKIRQLQNLGSSLMTDVRKYSPSTIDSFKSHVNLLERNNIRVVASTFDTESKVISIINSLRMRNGRPISETYKRQVAISLSRLYPELGLRPSLMFKKNKYKPPRLGSSQFVSILQQMIDNAGDYLKSVSETQMIRSLTLYDTNIAILLTCTTCLRISEIMQLTFSHIQMISDNVPVKIRSKWDPTQTRRIQPNDLLMSIFNTILIQHPLRLQYLKDERQHISQQSREYKNMRLSQNSIILSAIPTMRTQMKQLVSALGHSAAETSTVGFNSFRKYITSILIDRGGYASAQAMNNHTNIQTTVNHYANLHAPVDNTLRNILEEPESIKQELID